MWRHDDASRTVRGCARAADWPSIRWSSLKVWGPAVAKRRGMQKALLADACKLAIVLHRMWRDEKDFRWSAEAATVA